MMDTEIEGALKRLDAAQHRLTVGLVMIAAFIAGLCFGIIHERDRLRPEIKFQPSADTGIYTDPAGKPRTVVNGRDAGPVTTAPEVSWLVMNHSHSPMKVTTTDCILGPPVTYWTESDYRAHGLDPWKPKAPIGRHFVKAAGKLWRVELDGGRREIGEAK